MNLLILLNGHKDKVYSANKLYADDFDVIKLDEKDLAKPKKILGIVKAKKYEGLYFGCIELGLQRFQAFMLAYIFLSMLHKGALVDEAGSRMDYSIPKFLFAVVPAVIVEAFVSVFVVIYFYFKLGLIRMMIGRL